MSVESLMQNGRSKLHRKRDPIYSPEDWFTEHIDNWKVWLNKFKDMPDLQFLEIGSYEGRSARWLLENILTHPASRIYCIDVFDRFTEVMTEVKERFNHNIKPYQDKVTVFMRFSQEALRADPNLFCPDFFDFIYIDGCHEAYAVLEDAVLSFRVLKPGGLLVFDDYMLETFGDPKRNPKLAIDAWLACFEGQYELIYKGWQVCVVKK